MTKKIALILTLLSSSLFAEYERGAFGMNINTEDLEVTGRMPLASQRHVALRNFYGEAGFLNTKDDYMTHAGVFVENSPRGYSNITLNFGFKLLYSTYDAKDKSFVAMPITMGAKARMYLGNLPKSALGVKFAFAPKPLTFSDGKSYLEYRIETDMQVIDNIDLFLGYRHINTNYNDKDRTFNSAVYMGGKFVF